MRRSDEYDEWTSLARGVWSEICRQGGIPSKLEGRLRVDFIFIFNTTLSDVSNRVKALEDFLQKKFFENDNQIDEQHVYKRISKTRGGTVKICLSVIPDHRYDDPDLIF